MNIAIVADFAIKQNWVYDLMVTTLSWYYISHVTGIGCINIHMCTEHKQKYWI